MADLELTGWASFGSNLSPHGSLEQRSAETERALLVDHTSTVKVVRAYKIIGKYSVHGHLHSRCDVS